MTSALSFRNFELGYPTREGVRLILEGVTLEVPAGKLLLVLGPSGGGKTSLLWAILGLDHPFFPRSVVSGELHVLGERVHEELPASLRHKVGAVFQDGSLIDELSPRANVHLAVQEQGGSRERTAELLRRVGLPHPPRDVAALSGGERRRLALARALARSPQLLVLDEPTAGLDATSSEALARLVREVHDQSAAERTTLVITHDLAAFREVADGALLLNPRRGSLEWVEKHDMEPALESLEEETSRPVGPPPIVPLSHQERAANAAKRFLLSAASYSLLLVQALRSLVPYHLGMLARSLADLVLLPAPYIAITAATLGGLTTSFALDNNPLEAAFRREVLMGTGKILVGAALPLLVGVLFAARTAAGAASRIGGLRRAHVFEALPLMGISPYAFLLSPLLLSSLLATALLTALGIVSGCLAGLVVAHLKSGVTPFAWAAASFTTVYGSDLRWVFGKALLGGGATALIAFHLAARPKLSGRDVAECTQGAIVWSTLWVLLLHGMLTVWQYSP
ncbi:MAG: ATP-binding cassette domain-containing protein [Planctomycetota bacterium]